MCAHMMLFFFFFLVCGPSLQIPVTMNGYGNENLVRSSSKLRQHLKHQTKKWKTEAKGSYCSCIK